MILTAMGQGKNSGPMYPDFVGKRALFVGNGAGPTNATNADPVSLALTNYYIDAVLGGGSISGTYYVEATPNGVGPRATWSLTYYAVSNGAKQTGNLSAETFVISAFVGQY